MITELSADIQKIFKDSAIAVVEVREDNPAKRGGQGSHGRRRRGRSGHFPGSISGILWEDAGIILTVSHPLEDPDKIIVNGAGLENRAAVVRGWDNRYNLAVLQVEGAPAFKNWAGLESVSPGELVLSRGYNQIRMGLVARIEESRQTRFGGVLEPWVEVDGSLSPAQEGSALISTGGSILAINSSQPHPLGQSLGYTQLKKLVHNILENGSAGRAYLGITTSTGSTADGKKGLIITSVENGSPAETGGLLTGDFLSSLGGTALGETGDLFSALQAQDAGEAVDIDLQRGGVQKIVTISLGRR